MKKQNTLSILVIVLLVFGCASPATATRLPIENPVSHPSRTPMVEAQERGIKAEELATATSIPISTTEPPLKTKGPYFAYFREINGIYQLVMMDADGQGRKIIELPQGIIDGFPNKQYDLDMRLISPDGRWLAFYTGYAGSLDGQATGQPYDLTLNLLDLDINKTQVVTPLLSKDYPENFVEAAKQLSPPFATTADLQYTFLIGITHALAWSPNGRYLAFAGQMDGLSSDLYVYDLKTKAIRRLSSGSEELQWIDWSSDGKWILHGSTMWLGEGTEDSIYAAAVDGSAVHNLDYGNVGDWVNFHEILEYHEQNGLGKFELRLADVNTGEITEIWRGSFHDYVIDPSGDWVLLTAFTSVIPPEEENPNFSPGLQLINLRSLKKIQNPDLVSDPPNTFLRAEDGRTIPLVDPTKPQDEMIFASPDSNYWVIVADRNVRIYSSDITLIKGVSSPAPASELNGVQWRSDSSGLFLIYGTDIYSMRIPNLDIHLVETNLVDNYHLAYQWINSR